MCALREYMFNQLILSSKEIKKLINTDVTIELIGENESSRGFLKTIDPVSHTVVLQLKTDNESHIKIRLIPNHSINKVICHDQKIAELDRKSFEKFIMRELKLNKTDQIKQTQEKIIKQLEKNKFPCSVDVLDQSILVSDICKIKTPYREVDIECANFKVAKNLKIILKDVFLNEDVKKNDQ